MTDLHGEVPGVLPSHPCLIARHRLGLGLPDEVHVGCELAATVQPEANSEAIRSSATAFIPHP